MESPGHGPERNPERSEGRPEGYRERVRWPLWFHLIFAVFVALNVVVVAKAGEGAPPMARLVPAALAALLAYIWWRLRWLELRLDAEGAAFGFGGLKRVVPGARIRSVRVEEYSFGKYMGWGYRIGWLRPRDRAYSLPGCPRGVRLEFDDAQGRLWSVYLSSRDPDSAVAALNK